jgi:hypothetical protein
MVPLNGHAMNTVAPSLPVPHTDVDNALREREALAERDAEVERDAATPALGDETRERVREIDGTREAEDDGEREALRKREREGVAVGEGGIVTAKLK